MTFLQCLGGFGKKALFALTIIGCIALTAFAQKVAPQQEGRHYGDPGFKGEPVNLNVVNTDIRDILSYITEQYGINFVIDKSVSSIPVTVNVRDVPWNVALDSILQSQDLGVQVNGTILRIAQRKVLADESAIARQIRDNQLDTSPLYTEFIRLNFARASGSLQSAAGGNSAQFQGGTTSGSSAGGGTTGGGDKGILGIIGKRLSRRGSIEVDSRSNTLIVTDVRENIDAVRQLVGLLDQPEPQVEIEARIVIASRNFSRDIGVQLSALVLGNRLGQGGGAIASTLPGSTTTTSTNGALTAQPNNNLASQIGNSVIGLTTGVFGTAQISLLLTAGEQKGEAKTIATPRVSTLNNRTAKVESKVQIPVQNAQPSGGGAIATTQYVDVPLSLQITPQISDSGNVILSIVAENSSLAGGGAINSQSVKTQVMVPDGGTTVIGGVLSDDERESQDRTPGLSGIPFLGNLFKRKGVSRNTNELIFFITPRITRPDMLTSPNSGKMNDVMRTTTIIQPVPLGNPASNSDAPTIPLPPERNPLVTPVAPPVIPVQMVPGTVIKP